MRVDLLPENANDLTQLSSFRIEIDPTSNPSPLGGLLIPSPSNTQFNIPLLTSNGPGFGLCEAYVDDPSNDYDFTNISSGIVRFNNSGYYELGFNIYIISQAIETDGTIAMILKNGQMIFGSPPSCGNSRTNSDTYSALPGYYVKNLNANCNTKISAGDEIVLAIITNNVTPGNDISIQACTNMFCTRLNGNNIIGSSSIPSPVTNLENAGVGTELLINPGVELVSTQRNFKSLLAGTNISFVDSGSDITINASGGGTPNSDMANLGAGLAILATTGILPVTTTRNFKSLQAGTGIILSPTANTIQITSTSTNIYNTNGSLTANRTLTLNGFSFQITGSGNISLQPTAGTTTLGLNGWGTILAGVISMPHLASGSNSNVMLYNTATKAVTYDALTNVVPNKSIFSVTTSTNTFNIAGPYSANYQFPSGVALSYVSSLGNFTGYNNAGLSLDLVTGVYTPSQTNNYNISCKLTLKNDIEIPDIEIQLYDGTSGVVVLNSKYNSGVINTFNTYLMNCNINLTAIHTYTFRLIINNGAASTCSFENCIFSINLI